MADHNSFIRFGFQCKFPLKDLDGKEVDKKVCSEVFLTLHNGVYFKWRLELYPAGTTLHKVNNYLGWYFRLIDGLSPAAICLGPDGYSLDDCDTVTSVNTEYKTKEFNDIALGSDWGYARAIKLVKRGGHYRLPLKCTTVTFHFQFKILKSSFKPFPDPDPVPPICNTLGMSLYDSSKEEPRCFTVDTTLVSMEGIELHAHRSVLAACSEVFKTMFLSDIDKGNPSKKITLNVETVVLEELIHFSYLDSASASLEEHVIETLEAAHMYMLKALVFQCEKVMVAKLNEDKNLDQCVDYFRLGKMYNLKIVDNATTVMLMENWSKLGIRNKDNLKVYMDELMERAVELNRCQVFSKHMIKIE